MTDERNGSHAADRMMLDADFYHSRHACGHSVYWSDLGLAASTAQFPCPWCGGESQEQFPPDGAVLDVDGDICFQRLNKDGSVPAPGIEGAEVIIRHRADRACCE